LQEPSSKVILSSNDVGVNMKKANNFKKIAIKSALKGGEILHKYQGKVKKIGYKGVINLVTEADHLSEDAIIKIIRKNFPEHNILTEESKGYNKESDYKWIIDPLDGTTNYAHGFPVYCVSIALEIEGEIILGVVYNPVLEELFVAEKNKGAFLNGKRIYVSKTKELSRSLLATGFPYDIRESKINNLDHFTNFALRAQAIRRAGSAALDLCYLAKGIFDGFWELKLSPWDTAAGILMVKEAGGKVTDFRGENFSIYQKNILATNGKIHNQMIRVLKMGERE
jgi:myo-inositol-1(or 4)-monophosphatase